MILRSGAEASSHTDYLFLVDQNVVIPLILRRARCLGSPEAEGDPHVRERDDGQRHEILHYQQGNAERTNVKALVQSVEATCRKSVVICFL